jgi:hypothetical protein
VTAPTPQQPDPNALRLIWLRRYLDAGFTLKEAVAAVNKKFRGERLAA